MRKTAFDVPHSIMLLRAAAFQGHLSVVGRIAENGTSVNEKTDDESTPLHVASEKGHLTVVDRLIQLGTSVNEKGDEGWTPLHVASHIYEGLINVSTKVPIGSGSKRRSPCPSQPCTERW
jgi:ankyrin repeat protein